MTTNINEMKSEELKKLAKELKISNWWTLKKAELIAAIEALQKTEEEPEDKEEPEVAIPEAEDKGEPEDESEEGDDSEEEPGEPETTSDNLVTLKEIIAELGIKGTKARRILRGVEIERPYKRWEWNKDLHQEIIKQVKEVLSK